MSYVVVCGCMREEVYIRQERVVELLAGSVRVVSIRAEKMNLTEAIKLSYQNL